MTGGAPPAEVHIDVDLARSLLRDQYPDLAQLPLSPMDHGWDNVMFRLGDALSLRMPRRALAAQLIQHEQRWLPVLAPRVPIAVPAPVRIGVPGRGYPFPFSVLPWLAGEPADIAPVLPDQAQVIADFLLALHMPAPADAPRNVYRGVPLGARREAIELRMTQLLAMGEAINPRLRQIWDDALAAPVSHANLWLHGDLHARNVLVEAGRIGAVIDWGDLTSGDAATDLAAMWMLFEDEAACKSGLDRYLGQRGEPGLLARARGWAVAFGTLLLHSSMEGCPRQAAMGRAILRRVSAFCP